MTGKSQHQSVRRMGWVDVRPSLQRVRDIILLADL
jgi:hypothetical protein